ncbi:MAG: 7-cyano-7-deazaguanine synthase [Nanopusillaceae archaeon]
MCGIIGFFSKNQNDFFYIDYLRKLSIRGNDGFGSAFYSKKTNKIEFVKSFDFNDVEKIKELKPYYFLVGNSRAIPTTEMQQGAQQDLINQQPFENEEWIIVHNGGISNDLVLREKYSIVTESKVDSALLPDLFSKIGIIQGLKEIDGSYAICAFNKNTKTFWFGSNFMPLCYAFLNNDLYVASIPEMLPFTDVIKVNPYTLYEWDGINLKTFSLFRGELKKNVLVICSGGIDSVTTAYLYKHYGYDVSLLHFDYGHAAQEAERWSVQKIASHLNVPLYIYDATTIFNGFKEFSLLLSQKKADPTKQILDAESTLSYVPNRNMIFASIAGGIAEVYGISKVALGAQQMDGIAYPDNNVPFIESIDRSFKYSLNWYTNVSFRAPLIHLIKHEIVKLGLSLGVPYEYVCSCYYPELRDDQLYGCGECGCCQFRLLAFKMLGVKDPGKFLKDPTSSVSVKPIEVRVSEERYLPYM